MKTIRIILISSLFFIACWNIDDTDDPLWEPSGPRGLNELDKRTITYWDNGNRKAVIRYLLDGKTIGGITCYDSSDKEELCHPIRHGLPAAYMTVTHFDSPANTKVDNYIQYRDTAKTEKYYEFTYWESTGNHKTIIGYQADDTTRFFGVFWSYSTKPDHQADGVAKFFETTYWENGKPKISIVYQDDGETRRGKFTYWKSTGNLKTGILYQTDGVTKETEITYWKSTGNLKTGIVYQTDGETRKGETTHWESNGNFKTLIRYQTDGEAKKEEFTYWENGRKKTEIGYQSDGIGVLSIACFASNGEREICTQAKHGCTIRSTTCIN